MSAKQQMMGLLKTYLASFTMLTEEFLNDFDQKVKLNVFEKGHYLLRKGTVCEHMHYIETGCVQCYIGTKDRKETLWFMREGELAIFKNSFYDQSESVGSIVALEDTRVLSISYKDLEQLYAEHPFLERTGRKITEYYHKNSDLKSYVLYPKKPEERFDRYYQYRADIVHRIPQKQLASFLGLREETLSRLLREKRKNQ
ncbi:MAG TPA: Crp/Fnr family transcriptional regulator [Puia sp.]|jgi:CRP-like cAMP-binding protein|nr:Crp/Fnr family transcriptional regulator [Puia sp.]